MIAKKIPNPNKSASKHDRIASLVRYIRAPENRRKRREKCVYAGQRGFFVDDAEAVIKAMTGTAMAAARSPDTINHYVLSWPDGECPDEAQVEEAVTIFMHELGMDEFQVVYGLHADTDNYHLHLAVNRVHPESGRCVAINKGFDVEAIHRAAAKVEQAQGWSQCAHYLREGPGNDVPGLSTSSRDYEARTGEESAQRRAIEEAAPRIKTARSWDELHESLREVSMRYEKKGSGALVYVGSVPVKASKVARFATLARLESRLGRFMPAKQVAATVPEPEAKPVNDSSPKFRDYALARRQHAADAKKARAELRARHKSEREAMFESQKAEREALRRQGDWRGRRAQLMEQRSLLAMRHAKDKAALTERQRAEREALPSSAFPSFKEWLETRDCPEAIARWRYRDHGAPWGMIAGTEAPREEVVDIRGFVPLAVNGRVLYCPRGCQKAAFTDKGDHILVHDVHERANVLAALQLASQKWGSIKVWGSKEYIDACVDLAARHGFKIVNPELQERISRRREELRAKPATPDWKRLASDASEQSDRKALEDIVGRYERARDEIAREIAANLAKDVARARKAVAKNERLDQKIGETIDQANSVKGVLTDVVTFGGSYRKANKRIADLERRKTPGAQERLEQAEKEVRRFANVGSSGYFPMLHHEMEKKHPGLAEAGLLAQKELRKLEAEARAKRLAEEKSRNAGKTPPSNNGWSR